MAEHDHIWEPTLGGAKCTVKDCYAVLNQLGIMKELNEFAASEKREARLLEALAEHSLYYLDPAGNELFDQPLNWEANLLDDIKEGRIDQTVKKAAVDERELLEPRMLSQNIFLYGMAQLPVASSRTKPYEPFLTWAIEFAASEKREEGLRDIVKAGLVLTEGIGTEIGTSPLPPDDPDFTWEDALMALAIEFKSAALEALTEAHKELKP